MWVEWLYKYNLSIIKRKKYTINISMRVSSVRETYLKLLLLAWDTDISFYNFVSWIFHGYIIFYLFEMNTTRNSCKKSTAEKLVAVGKVRRVWNSLNESIQRLSRANL